MNLTLPAEFAGWQPTALFAWVRVDNVPALAQLWTNGRQRRWILVPHIDSTRADSGALPEASQLLTPHGTAAFQP